MDLLIRNKLKPGDIGSIIYLHGMLYAQEHRYDYSFEAYVAEPLGQFAKRDNSRERIWIVEKEGQVLGSIALCECTEQEAQLRWFLVSPELRGAGMGKSLMDSLLAFALDQSYQSISLWTVKGLEAARKIYTAFGFTLAEEVEHDVWGGRHTEQKYTLDLGCHKGDKNK